MAGVSDRKQLEEQFRLSQNLEAVGRLAGRIAHDFNNLFTVINGYGSMLADSLKGSPCAHGYAEEIVAAGIRAADLVSQLLTFSRRRMIEPKPIEVKAEQSREVDVRHRFLSITPFAPRAIQDHKSIEVANWGWLISSGDINYRYQSRPGTRQVRAGDKATIYE